MGLLGQATTVDCNQKSMEISLKKTMEFSVAGYSFSKSPTENKPSVTGYLEQLFLLVCRCEGTYLCFSVMLFLMIFASGS